MGRGARVAADLRKHRRFGAADDALIGEAARIIDRLDRLEAILAGDLSEWSSVDYSNGTRRLVIDDVLGEARQQVNTLRQIFATLKLAGVEMEDVKTDGVDEIGAKRARRRAGAKVQGRTSGGQ